MAPKDKQDCAGCLRTGPETRTTRRELANKLQEIETQIEAARRRLPAHSVKPALMMDLLRLEDERDSLLARLQTLRSEAK